MINVEMSRDEYRLRQLCAASVRASTGDPHLDLRGGYLFHGDELITLRAPHLYPKYDRDSVAAFRGAADGMAARRRYSDHEFHAGAAPHGEIAVLVFDVLEQLRVESLAPHLPGVRANLSYRHEQWTRQFQDSGLTETEIGLYLFTLVQVCRSRITGEPVLEETAGLIEHTRAKLNHQTGAHLLGLRHERFDQRSFAIHALRIAAWAQAIVDAQGPAVTRAKKRQLASNFNLLVDLETAVTEYSRAQPETEHHTIGSEYLRFTTAYDHVISAHTLVRRDQLREYRKRIDYLTASEKLNPAILARNLEALLCAPRQVGLTGGHDDGYVDGSRLAGLIASPGNHRVFSQPYTKPLPASSVTFLIDCSGSMKPHAESVAILVDTFVRALDKIGVSSEVLGFTTGAWNGGRPARDWLQAGSPARPGRLNELHHLVFKDADTNWQSARLSLSAFLKSSFYREGVDGEAVAWATTRLATRPGRRRILVVISDGSPSDTATIKANSPDYLDRHLRRTVADVETYRSVIMYGVGIGIDMDRYFPRTLRLDADHLGSKDSVHALFDLLRRTLPPLA